MYKTEIKEIKTVEDTMGERLVKLNQFVKYEQNKLTVKEIALSKAVNYFNKALLSEKDYVSVNAGDMMRQFMEMDLEKMLSTGIRVPIIEEQVGCRKYIMFIRFYEAENGMDLDMDLKKTDTEEMVTYWYNAPDDIWVKDYSVEDERKDVRDKDREDHTTINLLVEAGKKGDMSEQALHSFIYSDHESIYGRDIKAFANAVKPLVLLTNRLSGIAKLEILKNGQPAVVPFDDNHKGIAITYEGEWYVINHYYTEDMVLEDGTIGEKDKHFYINPVYRTEEIETAVSEIRNAISMRKGMMYPVTLVLSGGIILTIRDSNAAKMIKSIHEKMKELKKNKKITDTDLQSVTDFVDEVQKIDEES